MTGAEPAGPGAVTRPPSPGGGAWRALDVAVYALWVGVSLVGILHHEPFRDEALKWLIARDADSFMAFVRMLRVEASPALWLLLLLPFAKLGAPFWTAALVNYLCAAGAAALFWFRAPLPRLVKATALFSYFLLYDVPVIARNYSVMTLLCFTALALYPTRWRHPRRFGLALALLMNVNSPGVFTAATLAGVFLLDALRGGLPRRQLIAPGLILAAGALCAAAPVILAADMSALDEVLVQRQTLAGFLYGLKRTFPWVDTSLLLGAGGVLSLFLAGLLLRPRALLLALGAGVPASLVFWRGFYSRQYMTCLLVAVLMAAWLAALEPESPWRAAALRRAAGWLARLRAAAVYLLVLPFGFSVWFGLAEIAKEYRMNFSGAGAAAAFIRANDLDGLKMACIPDYIGITLLPYLEGRQVFYTGSNRWGTYVIRDTAHVRGERVPLREAVQRAYAAAAGDPRFLLILIQPVPLPPAQCRLLYGSDPAQTIWDENYFVYECRPGGWGPAAAPR